MLAVFLMLLVGGIAAVQAVSDPQQVTLRWLRLGGIISLCLLALTVAITVAVELAWPLASLISLSCTAFAFAAQIAAAQTGRRSGHQFIAFFGFLFASIATGAFLIGMSSVDSSFNQTFDGLVAWIGLIITLPLSSGLAGGFLMTMLLGHAYLTAGGEMTQKPFMRLTKTLAVLLMARLAVSGLFGAWPYFSNSQTPHQVWDVMMMTARYLVGLAVPSVFTYMIYDCVKRRANQSATGILYVALVLVIVGEGTALGLLHQTGYLF